MGACRHGQEEGTCPLWKCEVFFFALVVTAKRSVDELFMHYFHNLSSASGGFAPIPAPGAPFLDSAGYFCPQTPTLPIREKNPAGAHGHRVIIE